MQDQELLVPGTAQRWKRLMNTEERGRLPLFPYASPLARLTRLLFGLARPRAPGSLSRSLPLALLCHCWTTSLQLCLCSLCQSAAQNNNSLPNKAHVLWIKQNYCCSADTRSCLGPSNSMMVGSDWQPLSRVMGREGPFLAPATGNPLIGHARTFHKKQVLNHWSYLLSLIGSDNEDVRSCFICHCETEYDFDFPWGLIKVLWPR